MLNLQYNYISLYFMFLKDCLDLGHLLFVWQLFSDQAYVDHIKNGMF